MIKIILLSIAVLFSIAAMLKTYYDFRKKNESLTSVLLWFAVWLVVILVSVLPDPFSHLVERLNKEKIGIGTFVGLAFVFLLFIVYRLYLKCNRLEHKLKDLVTKIAIKDLKK